MRARIRSWFLAPTGRLRAPWRLLAVGVAFFLVNLLVVGLALSAGYPVDPTTATGAGLAAALGVLVANGAAVTAVVVLAARRLDRRVLGDIGCRIDDWWWADLAAGGAVGVGLVGGGYAVGLAIGVYRVTVAPAAPSAYSLLVWLAIVAAAMVAVGVYEELLLRGYVLTNLAEGLTAFLDGRRSVVGALALSSVGFGFLHGLNPSASRLSLATITLAGLMLGLGYVYTGSLALPVGVHVTWNLTHVLLGLPVSGLVVPVRLVETTVSGDPLVHGGAFGPEGGLLGLGTTLLGCLVVVGYARLTGRGFQEEIAVPALGDG
ncbi:CPBP family intramembrane glutamic endopeptidase [Natronomonas marina]|jgi:membrane protease YdiL (CAAX protease family)|uniref:CPBP family intramembrane glutamic endopeptidase n=1 Tax=Natronomonas marina TaxID=2961939 RepID=UPI0020C946C2|nr:CPBP family intramembrane glutamic endopeptidase [Natronomonas marina]